MIPVRRIADFLDKRTNNYEVISKKTDPNFTQFVSRIQSYRPNKSVQRWNNITIRNPQKYGYILASSMVSPDNRMAIWTLRDISERVSITLSCSDDAGQLTGWQVRKDGLKKEQEAYPTWHLSSREDKNYLIITSSHREYPPTKILYYK
jgi:hypothetical protein